MNSGTEKTGELLAFSHDASEVKILVRGWDRNMVETLHMAKCSSKDICQISEAEQVRTKKLNSFWKTGDFYTLVKMSRQNNMPRTTRESNQNEETKR